MLYIQQRTVLSIAILVAGRLNFSDALVSTRLRSCCVASPAENTSALHMKTKQATSTIIDEAAKTTYGEIGRQYRRTVYSHDEWVQHRSPERFYRNLSSTLSSGVFQNLSKEVFTTTAIATFVIFWNCLFGQYEDLHNVVHNGPFHDSLIPVLVLPLAPFTISSPSLGLLLGKFPCFTSVVDILLIYWNW